MLSRQDQRPGFFCLFKTKGSSLLFIVPVKKGNAEIIQDVCNCKDTLAALSKDDDQSIYGFRGASPDIMLRFGDYFPNARQICLSENYRSVKVIVSAAGRVIDVNRKQLTKPITAVKEDEGELVVREYKSREEEYLSIVGDLKTLDREELGKTAVLFRNNSLCASFTDVLNKNSIPFKCRETEST